jgi:predicted PurR-regulated permease PerM
MKDANGKEMGSRDGSARDAAAVGNGRPAGFGEGTTIESVQAPQSTLTALAVAVFVVTALYVGREVLVPISLAVLLSFLLAPLVRILQRARLGRVLPVLIAVLLSFSAFVVLAGVIAAQLAELASDLPRYQTTMLEKIRSLRESFSGGGSLSRLAEVLQRLAQELQVPTTPSPGDASVAPAPGNATAVPVIVRQPDEGPLDVAGRYLGPLLKPLGTFGLVLLFSVFILLQREDLRNRIIRLAGSQDLQRTTSAIDDAARRLSRLFVTQFALNAAYAAVIAGALWLIGLPSAILFGIVAGVLRFVPYIGGIIGSLIPIVFAAAVEPGWSVVVQVTLVILVIDTLVGHVIEPLVYGRSTGLSPVAVVVSATFWTWLWGPIGLLLATPLTVCLVVLGRHVEHLEFLEVALGDRPPLTPVQSFYQRLLAGDPEEAAAQAETLLAKQTLPQYLDEVALPALLLAQFDADRGVLDEKRLARLRNSTRIFVSDVGSGTDGEEEPALLPARPVLLVGGRSGIDDAANLLLADLLGRKGLATVIATSETLARPRVELPGVASGQVVAVGFMQGDQATLQMRYRIRRIRRALPDVRLLLCAWGLEGAEAAEALRVSTRVERVATTLEGAMNICLEMAMADVVPATEDVPAAVSSPAVRPVLPGIGGAAAALS